MRQKIKRKKKKKKKIEKFALLLLPIDGVFGFKIICSW
jgi:hypothetical protein